MTPADRALSDSPATALHPLTLALRRRSRRFAAGTLALGLTLGTSQATAADATLVKNLNPNGTRSSDLRYLTPVDGRLFLVANDSATDTDNSEIWVSDGTEAGTVKVREINQDTLYPSAAPTDLTAYDGQLLFVASGGSNNRELYRSDGTEAGTQIVKDIYPGNNASQARNLNHFDDRVYFLARQPKVPANTGISTDIWRTDGTETGTVKAVNLGDLGIREETVQHLTAAAGRLYFQAGTEASGVELWTSDGSTAQRVADINPTGDSFPSESSGRPADRGAEPLPDTVGVGLGCTLLFVANDGVNGRELWATQGTAESTRLVRNIAPADADANIRELTYSGGKVYFTADDGSGRQLWVTDGTESGTLKLTDFTASTQALQQPRFLIDFKSRLYFSAFEATTGVEPWVSDGTVDGTRLFRDVNPGGANSVPREMGVANNLLLLNMNRPSDGPEPWSTDGTESGTRLVADVLPGGYPAGSSPANFAGIGDTLYFSGYVRAPSGADRDRELYKVEGVSGEAGGDTPNRCGNPNDPNPVGDVFSDDFEN